MGSPESAFEVIDDTVRPTDFRGERVEMNVGGRAVLHAVEIVGDEVRPECGQSTRRLLPTGRRWSDPEGDHVERCAACLQRFPVERDT
jgi:hypothetical protein